MSAKRSQGILMGLAALAGVSLVHGQHAFERTKTVDLKTVGDPPEPVADFDNIQDAIGACTEDGDKWTVLIYPGEYELTEPLTLDGADENIDLVGIDREAVIISVTGTDKHGIVITSGTETARNNSIRNLTIKTTNGHGIEIVKGGTPVPENITIEGVTIEANGEGKHGIEGSAADTVRITDCKIAADGHGASGIRVGHNFEIIGSIVSAAGTSPGGAPSAVGVRGTGKDGVRIRNCKITGSSMALNMQGQPEDLQVYGCELLAGGVGVTLWNGDNVVFEACHIVVEGNSGTTRGVFVDHFGPLAGDITFVGCRIEATGAGTQGTIGAWTNTDQNASGQLRLVGCDISATCTNTTSGSATGVGEAGAITIIGGSVSSSAAAEKETEVWDLNDGVPTAKTTIRVSRTCFSKWKGPIFAAGRKQSVVQRMLNVAQADPAKLADSADLDGVPIHPGLVGVLATYRALKVTWNNASGEDITITVSGINWAGDDIAEEFELSVGSPAKEGSKPFKIVETIYIPDAPGTISVGTTSKLGLYYPISADSDVLQEARLVNGVYTSQAVGTVDEVYSTVIPSTITAADSFEWAVLASQ